MSAGTAVLPLFPSVAWHQLLLTPPMRACTLPCTDTANAAVGAAALDTFLKPNYAMRIDTKMDDADPNTGDVLAAENGAAGVANCVSAGTQAGVYNEALPNALCALYIKFQN